MPLMPPPPGIHLTDDERALLLAAAVAMIGAVMGIVTALLRRLQDVIQRVDESKHTLEKVRTQVQNDHGTNLRDDMDRIAASVDKMADSLEAERHYRSRQDGILEESIKNSGKRITRLESKLDWLKEGVNHGSE